MRTIMVRRISGFANEHFDLETMFSGEQNYSIEFVNEKVSILRVLMKNHAFRNKNVISKHFC